MDCNGISVERKKRPVVRLQPWCQITIYNWTWYFPYVSTKTALLSWRWKQPFSLVLFPFFVCISQVSTGFIILQSKQTYKRTNQKLGIWKDLMEKISFFIISMAERYAVFLSLSLSLFFFLFLTKTKLNYSAKILVKSYSWGAWVLFMALWTTACQSPLSMGFSRQEY